MGDGVFFNVCVSNKIFFGGKKMENVKFLSAIYDNLTTLAGYRVKIMC